MCRVIEISLGTGAATRVASGRWPIPQPLAAEDPVLAQNQLRRARGFNFVHRIDAPFRGQLFRSGERPVEDAASVDFGEIGKTVDSSEPHESLANSHQPGRHGRSARL